MLLFGCHGNTYLSHEDEPSVEDHQQSVLVVLQQNPEGTEKNHKSSC